MLCFNIESKEVPPVCTQTEVGPEWPLSAAVSSQVSFNGGHVIPDREHL